MSDRSFTELSLSVSGFPMQAAYSLSCRSKCVDGLTVVGQGKHMALCVVGADMSRLSIDQGICPRERLWVEISNQNSGGDTMSGQPVQPCTYWHRGCKTYQCKAVSHICTLENVLLFRVLSRCGCGMIR